MCGIVGYVGPRDSQAILLAGLCWTIQYLMAGTHTWGGVNYADAFNTGMTVSGILLALLGAGLLASEWLPRPARQAQPAEARR